MSTAAKKTSAANGAKANGNGERERTPEEIARTEAIAYEEKIREEAHAIWENRTEGHKALDADLLRELRPLLRKPIPSGFIEYVGKVEGKPYESTGVKSVQVQMDRLDNVLGPDNWGYEATYSESGKLCYVRAWIGSKAEPLMERDSYGGVNRGSTTGNLYKGSFTNAAKPCLARLGPAWEVYVGAADFDPDTDPASAEQQAKADAEKPPPVGRIDGERVAKLSDLAHEYADAGEDEDEQKKRRQKVGRLLSSEGAEGKTISERISSLTPGAADKVTLKLEEWSA